MVRDAVKSSLIVARGYDAETQTLEIEFHKGKKSLTNPVYSYTPFSADRWEEFKAAPSAGKYFLANIKSDKELTVTRLVEAASEAHPATGEGGIPSSQTD
jgi:hypothetical protein